MIGFAAERLMEMAGLAGAALGERPPARPYYLALFFERPK
jgi:hypothetical protein